MKLNKEQQDAIRQWFDESGYSLSEAAKALNAKSHVSVKNWMEKENAGIHNDTYKSEILPKIKKYLNPTPPESTIPDKLKEPYENLKYIYDSDKSQFWITEQFLRNTASVVKDKKMQKEIIPFKEKQPSIPYLSQKVSAGNGVELLPERHPVRPDFHYMDVHGESMEPTYRDGQKILIHRFEPRVVFGENDIPIEDVMSLIKEDSVIIYDLNDSGPAMKRVKYQMNEDNWYFILHSDNADWAEVNDFPRVIRKADDFAIYGIVLTN